MLSLVAAAGSKPAGFWLVGFWLLAAEGAAGRRRFRINAERLHALAIQRDFEQLILRVVAEQQIDGGLEQLHLDDVLAIQRKIVMDQDAAARAQRQAFDVLVLREVGADAIGVRRWDRSSDRQRPGG